jgi:hypothetical protein
MACWYRSAAQGSKPDRPQYTRCLAEAQGNHSWHTGAQGADGSAGYVHRVAESMGAPQTFDEPTLRLEKEVGRGPDATEHGHACSDQGALQ